MKMLEAWLSSAEFCEVLASCPVTDVVPPVFGKPSSLVGGGATLSMAIGTVLVRQGL